MGGVRLNQEVRQYGSTSLCLTEHFTFTSLLSYSTGLICPPQDSLEGETLCSIVVMPYIKYFLGGQHHLRQIDKKGAVNMWG